LRLQRRNIKKKIEREEKLNKHLIKEHQRPPQKVKTGKTPTITGWGRKIKSEKKGSKKEKHFGAHEAENKIKNFTPYQFC